MSMIIMNGSPKAERGNTEVFIRKFMEGMQAAEGTTECASAQVCYVAKESHEEIAAKMQEYDTIIIAFPLYVHAMPGTVKKVLEYMKPVEGSCFSTLLRVAVRARRSRRCLSMCATW